MIGAANSGPASEATAWHAIPADEVVRRLGSNTETGLEPTEASARVARYGPNRLPEAAKQGPFMRLLLQFNNVLVYVLLGAGFVKAMMGLWLDASVILGVVVLNALLGFVQEGRAEKALDSIRGMLSAEARTVRGGETRMTPARIGRPDPGGSSPRRGEEPANGGGGAHG
jgi:magnesium-transporting ATPase (P-type)